MKKIASGVYLEKAYPGVMVGAVSVDERLLLIDAPLRPDDGREWLNALRNTHHGSDRMLVYLDSHTDRTLGGQVLESTIIAHMVPADINLVRIDIDRVSLKSRTILPKSLWFNNQV